MGPLVLSSVCPLLQLKNLQRNFAFPFFFFLVFDSTTVLDQRRYAIGLISYLPMVALQSIESHTPTQQKEGLRTVSSPLNHFCQVPENAILSPTELHFWRKNAFLWGTNVIL